MNISHILLTTDLSPNARHGYPYAVRLARTFGAHVTLLHVRELLYGGLLPQDTLEGYEDSIGAAYARRLQAEQRYLASLGVDASLRAEEGNPAREIVRFAENHLVDLVVLTSHGNRGPHRLRFGSTAKRVVRHLRTPFLVIPADVLKPGRRDPSFDHLVTTTDFSLDSSRGLDASLQLAAQLDARVTLVHVIGHPPMIPAISGEAPIHLPEASIHYLRRHHQSEVDALVASRTDPRLAGRVVVHADVTDGIVATITELQADLVVVPSHGKGTFRAIMLGSTTEQLMNFAPVPVLVLPRAFLEQAAVAA